MARQLMAWISAALEGATAFFRVLIHLVWVAIRPPLVALLEVLAALVVMFEEWGWKPLSDALAWLHRFRLVARLESWIASLPPYPALLLFAAPAAILFPVKIFAVWLLAKGHLVSATTLFLGGKLLSTALVARLFILTRPALMQVVWFRHAYDWFMPWKELMYQKIRASWVWRRSRIAMKRIRAGLNDAWSRIRPVVRDRLAILSRRGREAVARVIAAIRALAGRGTA